MSRENTAEVAWGASQNNRRARFYSRAAKGKRHLAAAEENWARRVAFLNCLLTDG